MEIRDYFKEKRRWLPALVLVPLLAGAATVGYVSLQPAEVTAEVRSYVPPSLTSSDSQIGLYIARLNEALRLDEVTAEVAAVGQVRPGQLDSITAERNGQSDQFTLIAVTTAPEESAVPLAEAAVKVGTAFVARQSLQGADINTELAQADFDRAQAELFAYQDEIGDLDPNITYSNVSRELLNPGAGTEVAALTARQDELVGQVRRFNELKAAFQTTSGTLGAAQAQSNGHSAEIITAESGRQILFSKLDDQGVPGMRFLESAGLAVVLAFLAVLGLSLLPDLLRRTPRGTATVSRGDRGPVSESPTTAIEIQDRREPRLVPPRQDGQVVNGAPVVRSGQARSGRD